MRGRGLRARALVDDYLLVVAVAFLALVLAGGVLTYTAYADPGTSVETRVTGNWESVGEFTHRATVVEETDPFPAGTVLRNRSVYFRQVAPVLNGSFAYGYTATGGGDLAANASVVLVIRSATEGEEGATGTGAAAGTGAGTEFWRVERRLGTARADSLAPGERLRVPFSVNASAVEARARQIEDQLGSTPGETQILLLARVDVSGTRNGQPVERVRTYRMPLTVDADVYRVDDPGRVTASGRNSERVTVPATPGPLRRFGGPALLVAGLAGLAGLAAARHRGDLDVSPAERAWLAYRSDRAEFDDWITTARLPADLVEGPTIAVDSLEGLVDVAIDTDKRVIEDAGRNRFVVLDDDVGYVFTPPAEPPTAGGALGPDSGGVGTVPGGQEADGERPAAGAAVDTEDGTSPGDTGTDGADATAEANDGADASDETATGGDDWAGDFRSE